MLLSDKSVLTFDCFGTLVDWETGIWEAFQPFFRRAGASVERNVALQWYATAETEAEAGIFRPYRSVLADVFRSVGSRVQCTPTPEETGAFCSSITTWPVFPDSARALRALKRHFRLAVITNCDDDLFAGVGKNLGVEFDAVITAQQARAYKPSLVNFRLAVERLAVPVERILHVACSLYHDHVPARKLGITSAWINRRHGETGAGATPDTGVVVKPDYLFHDLDSFADFILRGAN